MLSTSSNFFEKLYMRHKKTGRSGHISLPTKFYVPNSKSEGTGYISFFSKLTSSPQSLSEADVIHFLKNNKMQLKII